MKEGEIRKETCRACGRTSVCRYVGAHKVGAYTSIEGWYCGLCEGKLTALGLQIATTSEPGRRLKDDEWSDKKCQVCGAPATMRLKDLAGNVIGYRCREHVPTPREMLSYVQDGKL